MNEYFTKAEAQNLQGRRVRALIDFCDVPKGTAGTVVGYWAYPQSNDYGVNVRWDPPVDLHDGFSKKDYALLEEI